MDIMMECTVCDDKEEIWADEESFQVEDESVVDELRSRKCSVCGGSLIITEEAATALIAFFNKRLLDLEKKRAMLKACDLVDYSVGETNDN